MKTDRNLIAQIESHLERLRCTVDYVGPVESIAVVAGQDGYVTLADDSASTTMPATCVIARLARLDRNADIQDDVWQSLILDRYYGISSSDAWTQFIGGQTPQEFCVAGEAEDVSAVVADYLDSVQAGKVFNAEVGPDLSDEEIATLQRALVEYIEDDLAIEAGRTGYTLASAAELGDLDPSKTDGLLHCVLDARASLGHPCTITVCRDHDGIHEQIGNVNVALDEDGVYSVAGEVMAELCDEIEYQLNEGHWSGRCLMLQDEDHDLPRVVEEDEDEDGKADRYSWYTYELSADSVRDYRPTQYDRVTARWHRAEKRPVVARKIWGVRWAYVAVANEGDEDDEAPEPTDTVGWDISACGCNPLALCCDCGSEAEGPEIVRGEEWGIDGPGPLRCARCRAVIDVTLVRR